MVVAMIFNTSITKKQSSSYLLATFMRSNQTRKPTNYVFSLFSFLFFFFSFLPAQPPQLIHYTLYYF
ncbi:hypothetical protein AX774_g2845 [Zancudomyces culisetae]|uniref:Uncharacterized protein n=1 Tax=Zancudomyces culisetae TaxID=1213189 RepID=A0A1R1PRN0_ZANCU|nr:hypothetical protein AX774_g2845 [Zancudomyces culisetae]|eukprot:OMH83640.1 hypothetical protein AX774_g2845 [Zancudomyces culisetae]